MIVVVSNKYNDIAFVPKSFIPIINDLDFEEVHFVKSDLDMRIRFNLAVVNRKLLVKDYIMIRHPMILLVLKGLLNDKTLEQIVVLK